jgi:hypothetical protein
VEAEEPVPFTATDNGVGLEEMLMFTWPEKLPELGGVNCTPKSKELCAATEIGRLP